MKQKCSAAVFFLAAVMGVIFPASLPAEGPVISGILDTKVSFSAGAGEMPDFSYGIEEYANLRMRSTVGDRGTIYAAFNLIAAAGAGAFTASLTPEGSAGSGASALVTGDNYSAALDLERLYFRVNSDFLDVEAGLMRLAFGYGQVWRPSDFLNPRNPLFPDLRPRAVLGGTVAVYPSETMKIQGFGAAPRNSLNLHGSGAVAGAAGDMHWERLSMQALYAYESPREETPLGLHRGGLSLKAELELGFILDLMYLYNHDTEPGIRGLSASAGFDYSFYDGRFYVLAEYLYSGAESVTSGEFSNRNYIYGMVLYRFTDYTNLSLACMASIDDVSFSPVVTLEHDLFQGMTLSLTGRVPLDRDLFSGDGNHGELGPDNSGTRLLVSAAVRFRF
ncbi:hypothetical protein [Breznakiella homolactica]|uniref:Porin n=1 Tax=Breznakiella homolactica TaxID=2798577 RepID=A0A7T7XJN3_9SPIR|nr:hypothetical protein [Breznakiella homolactica]QQO07452.1 hypothetical protein JFL75_10820 [Breznakiella homolactica]